VHTHVPVVAAIAMRPCFSSTARQRANFSGLVFAKANGSQYPSGPTAPSSVSTPIVTVIGDARGASVGAWKPTAAVVKASIDSLGRL